MKAVYKERARKEREVKGWWKFQMAKKGRQNILRHGTRS